MLNRSKERRVRDTHPSPFRWLYFWWQFLTESCLEPFESQLWYLTCWLPYALCHIIQFHADVSDTLESLRDQQYLHVGNWALNSLAIKEQWFHTAPEEWFRRPDTKYMLWDDSWRNPLTVLTRASVQFFRMPSVTSYTLGCLRHLVICCRVYTFLEEQLEARWEPVGHLKWYCTLMDELLQWALIKESQNTSVERDLKRLFSSNLPCHGQDHLP